MNLFFAKIHGQFLLGNFHYAYIWSWFGRVHFVAAAVPKRWLKRFSPVILEETFTYDEWTKLRDETWSEWAAIVPRIPAGDWKMRVCGVNVDFYRIALQNLSEEYLAHRQLVHHIERSGIGDAWIADTVAMRYIRTAGAAAVAMDGKAKVARGGWWGDMAYKWMFNLSWALTRLLLYQARSAFRAASGYDTVDILHEGLSVEGSGSIQHGELSFSWMKDLGVCREKQIVFMLENWGKPRLKQEAPDIWWRGSMLRGLGWKTALKAMWHGARLLVGGLLHVARPTAVFLTEYGLRCVAPYLFVEKHKTRIYLTTNSVRYPEYPSTALYNAMGLRTILWAYGSNLSLFNQSYLSAEKNFYAAHLEIGECWLWMEHRVALCRQSAILPSRTDYRHIGPVMMADAAPCLVSPAESRRRHLGLPATENNRPTIAVFDINPVSKEGQRALQIGPLVITEELVEAFYQHLIRLLEAFQDIRLLVKTKRDNHPYKTKVAAQKRLVDPAGEWVRSGRVIDLDPSSNPYIPIGAADLTIGVPFTSPVLAGLHFGRPGLFHDSLGVALQHHYHDLDELITHGYEDLQKKVRFWLSDRSEQAMRELLARPETRRFLGPRPGADPAEEFGKALWGENFTLQRRHDAQNVAAARPDHDVVSTGAAYRIAQSSVSK